MKRSTALAAFLIMLAGAMSVSAQDSTPAGSPGAKPAEHNDMSHMNMSDSASMHEMPATVESVDHKTGVVEVMSENMKLKVHFPPTTVAELKKGDQIKLHLGYTKG